MRLTLADVVGEEEFGLALRSGSPAALTRPVEGAETVEVDRPEDLSTPGYIVLTTGVRLRGNPEGQRKLVIEAEARGVAAIGFGVGLGFRSTPRALLDEAGQRDFPVFEVPYDVPFRDIIAYINRSHFSEDFYSLKRTLALQNTLLGALDEARPEQALVNRLATIIGGSVVLYRPDGGVVAAAGDPPVLPIWEEIARRSGEPEVLGVDPWQVFVSPILVEGDVRFWLALASRSQPSLAGGITGPLVQVAERLLRLVELAREVGVMEERVRRSELLQELLDEGAGVSRERLELFGFEPDRCYRVVLIALSERAGRSVPASTPDLAEAARRIGNAATAGGQPHLVGEHQDHLALVVQDGAPVEAWIDLLTETGLDVWGAVGRPVAAPERLVDSRGDALLALAFLRRLRSPSGRVLRFEEFELADVLLSTAAPGQLRARSALLIDPLRAHPQLLESLVVWLDCDLNVNAAAERLHLHPNSLRYRLGRIEEVLGRSLHDLATIVDLHLAHRAETRLGPL